MGVNGWWLRALGATLVLVTLCGAAAFSGATTPEDTVMVMVAARDLHPGVVIEEHDLIAVPMPPRLLPDGVFLSPGHVVGERPSERILAAEVVRFDRLASPASGSGLNGLIPAGQRAISIEIPPEDTILGFAAPGDIVDLLVHTVDGGVTTYDGGGLVVLDLKRVAPSATDEDGWGSVTLLASPVQAEQIAQAERTGSIGLSLRNGQDTLYEEPVHPHLTFRTRSGAIPSPRPDPQRMDPCRVILPGTPLP